MACLLEVLSRVEIIALVMAVLLGLTVLTMIRDRRPDPKMELLLSLMKVFPEDARDVDHDDKDT